MLLSVRSVVAAVPMVDIATAPPCIPTDLCDNLMRNLGTVLTLRPS